VAPRYDLGSNIGASSTANYSASKMVWFCQNNARQSNIEKNASNRQRFLCGGIKNMWY